jgi:hypothetical protein
VDDPDPDPLRVPALPNLLVREATVAAVLVAAVMMLAIFFNAPLAAPANPGLSPNPTKAPWYFSGLQELLLHLHPTFAVFVIPFFAGAALVCIPYMQCPRSIDGVWFVSRYGRRTAMQAAVAASAVTALLIGLDEWVAKPGQWFSGMPDQIGRGLIPTVLLLAAAVGVYRLVKGRGSACRSEAVQAVFVLVATSFVVLTITGWWFRGKGMSLAWPW